MTSFLRFVDLNGLGLAPHIEEDVASSSITQDTMGHAAMYYNLFERSGVEMRMPLHMHVHRRKEEIVFWLSVLTVKGTIWKRQSMTGLTRLCETTSIHRQNA